MKVEQNLTLLAKGGGCFLANTQISTPMGDRPIQYLMTGDRVISLNEETGEQQISTVASVESFKRDHFYTINGNIKVTGEHPFYTVDGIVEVKDLVEGDVLKTRDGDTTITSIEYKAEEVLVFNLIEVTPNHNYFANSYLVHNKGFSGGRSSGGFSSRSSSSSSSSKSSSKSSSSSSKSSSKSSTPSKPKTGTSTAKPGSTIKTANGKTVKTSTKAPTNKKYTSSKGVVGDNGYTPRYQNGYTPPAGSVVYRENNSALDYLPWIYLFSLGGDSPRNDKEVIIQPDGKEVKAQPEPKGVDGMYIFNWFILILIGAAIISGIVYGVYKWSNRSK